MLISGRGTYQHFIYPSKEWLHSAARWGDGEMGRWGDWEIGRLGDWEIGRLGDGKDHESGD